MTLRWKAFEQRLWAQVREHDLRRRMSHWRRILLATVHLPLPLWALRSLFFLIIAGVMIIVRDSLAAHAEVWIAGMGLWAFLVTQIHAGIILNLAREDPQYRTLWMLPLTGDEVYGYLVRRVIWANAWLLMEFGLLYGLVATTRGGWGTAVLCCALQAGLGLALLLWIVRRRAHSDNIVITVLLLLLGAIMVPFLGSKQTVRVATEILYWCHPFGWPNAIFAKGIAMAWWGLLPMLAVLATIPFSLRVLRRLNADGFFCEVRTKVPNLPRWVAKEEPPQDWTEFGFVERLLARFLNPRERILAGTLFLGRPRWSQAFCGLLIYTVLFLIANRFIYFRSLEDVVSGIANLDARSGAALVGCVAAGIFLVFMTIHGLSLFIWVAWPEWVSSFFTFRLFPMNYWELIKMITKVNTILVLLLLPPATLVSFTPVLQSLEFFRNGVGIMPKCLAALWGLTLLASSLRMILVLEEWRYWRFWLIAGAVSVGVCALALSLLMSPVLMLDLIVIGALLVITPAWITYAGFRYCRAFR